MHPRPLAFLHVCWVCTPNMSFCNDVELKRASNEENDSLRFCLLFLLPWEKAGSFPMRKKAIIVHKDGIKMSRVDGKSRVLFHPVKLHNFCFFCCTHCQLPESVKSIKRAEGRNWQKNQTADSNTGYETSCRKWKLCWLCLHSDRAAKDLLRLFQA